MSKQLIIKRIFVLMILVAPILSGCDLINTALSDIGGWDVSACWGNIGVCYDLFSDNEEKILGGQTVIDLLLTP
jgi:hypothetical protein